MTEFTEEENARTLKAWNAWKEVCWVHGLGKPRGDSLPIIGTAEDEKLLSDMIQNAFRRKLTPYIGQLEDDQGSFSFSNIDCAQEFDAALCEYEHVDIPDRRCHDGVRKLRAKKAWKDDVWQAVATSEDHPVKVIVGKLLGNMGVIDRIVEEWLRSNFVVGVNGDMLVFHSRIDTTEPETKTDRESSGVGFLGGGALDAISSGCDKKTADVGGALSEEAPVTLKSDAFERVPKSWQAELEQAFSVRLCCLMFAHINGVKIYADTEILSALGIGKTTAAQNLNKAQDCLSGLNPELRDWILCDDAGTRFFRKWIESRCQAEKAGVLILSRMKEQK